MFGSVLTAFWNAKIFEYPFLCIYLHFRHFYLYSQNYHHSAILLECTYHLGIGTQTLSNHYPGLKKWGNSIHLNHRDNLVRRHTSNEKQYNRFCCFHNKTSYHEGRHKYDNGAHQNDLHNLSIPSHI